MGRQNASKNVSEKAKRKTRLLQSKESSITSKKMSNKKHENGESDDVDSLLFLKEAGENKKLKGLDERIKLLKAELKSLIGDRKTDKDPDSTLVSIYTSHFDVKKLETATELEGCIKESHAHESVNFSPNDNSTPAKFSEWLDKTICEMDSKSQDTVFLGKESQFNSKLESNVKISPLKSYLVCPKTSSSNASLLPTERVKELLYKAFLLQINSATNFSHSEVGGSEDNVSIVVEKQEKSQKLKAPKRKPVRGKPKEDSSGFKTCCRYPERRKRRRLINTSESDIEVIDLESSVGINNILKTHIECVDLDVSNYDWSEPFEVNDTEFHSDSQIKQDSDKSNENIIQANETASKELDKSISPNNTLNVKQKKIWECPVCFEQSKGQEIVATQCGHIFCKKCLENHISKLTNNCPSCRCNLKNKPFITLFNF